MGKPAFCIGENNGAGVPELSLITNIERAVVTNPTIWALRQVKTWISLDRSESSMCAQVTSLIQVSR